MDQRVVKDSNFTPKTSSFGWKKSVFNILSKCNIYSPSLVFNPTQQFPLNSYIFLTLCAVLSYFSCAWLCETLWTVACQAPLSVGFCRQEYWSGQSFPSPENFHMIQQFHFWVYISKRKVSKFSDICTFMYTETLFTIAKRRKEPNQPSTDDWITTV